MGSNPISSYNKQYLYKILFIKSNLRISKLQNISQFIYWNQIQTQNNGLIILENEMGFEPM